MIEWMLRCSRLPSCDSHRMESMWATRGLIQSPPNSSCRISQSVPIGDRSCARRSDSISRWVSAVSNCQPRHGLDVGRAAQAQITEVGHALKRGEVVVVAPPDEQAFQLRLTNEGVEQRFGVLVRNRTSLIVVGPPKKNSTHSATGAPHSCGTSLMAGRWSLGGRQMYGSRPLPIRSGLRRPRPRCRQRVTTGVGRASAGKGRRTCREAWGAAG